MGPLDLLIHLLSFFAPAVAVALGVALAGLVLVRRTASTRPWWVHAAINFVVGAAVLALGLWS
jgi:hypothetical protein